MSVLEKLTALRTLDLSGCKSLTDLSALEKLTALNSLNLSYCKSLTDLSALEKLTALNSLDLSCCESLRSFMPVRSLLTHLNELYLIDAPFDDLDPALCGQPFENVLPKVRAHFADAEHQAVDDAEFKMFLLGNGGVGKTQLRGRLCGRGFDESVGSTHGVEVERFRLSLEKGRDVWVNLWDFGGQDIYHGTHALFLQRHALFVILWHPGKESGTVEDHGLLVRNRPLEYWLDFVRAVAGVEAPVIVVQSQFDDPTAAPAKVAADLSDFQRPYVVQASAKADDGLDTLLPELKRSVQYLIKQRPILKIGAGRVRVRDQLRKWLAADQKKPAEKRKYRTLPWEKFVKLCEKGRGDVSNPESLADYLHQTGFLIYDPKLFRGEIILDQGWALEAIYAVFHRRDCVTRLRRSGGHFTREDLGDWLWNGQGHSVDDQKRFVGMMLRCGICFRRRKLTAENERPEVWEYTAPDHLPTLEEFERQNPSIELPDPETARAAVKVEFRFLHDGLLRSLLARIGEVTKNTADYWRYGCYFRNPQSDLRLRFDSTIQADGPSAEGSLSFSAWGEQSRKLLERLIEEVRRLSPGQPVNPEWRVEDGDDRGPVDLRVGRQEDGPDLKTLLGPKHEPSAGPGQYDAGKPGLPDAVRSIDAMCGLTFAQLQTVAEGLDIDAADLPREDQRAGAVMIHRHARRDRTGERLRLLQVLICRYDASAFD
ncbi:MAG: COR domain-containing protein [Isosphaeraceae bacterium]